MSEDRVSSLKKTLLTTAALAIHPDVRYPKKAPGKPYTGGYRGYPEDRAPNTNLIYDAAEMVSSDMSG